MAVPLPIDALLPTVCATLAQNPNLVVEAEPGAGKTTRVPPALLRGVSLGDREVLVLEPRRLAARLAARRVAEEMGERVGETVGYAMRFEHAGGPRTRLRFVTEGVLTRRLLSDPDLDDVGAVVLDEFHERHLQGDVALALLRRLQRLKRPDLKLVVMSATLDAAPIVRYLDARALRAEGRPFAVAIEHAARADDRPLELQVASAVRDATRRGLDGDILVFLPGFIEIRRAMEACEPIAHGAGLEVLPLHGSLSVAEQDRAVRPSAHRKLVVSTNVAESSVTIDGVTLVIDSGLARVAAHAPWSGLPTLRIARVSRASATQRAGRAGRTRPGRCVRLFTLGDYQSRPEHDAPEIARVDLAETALELSSLGIELDRFEWYEPPPSAALEAAATLLRRLGAVDEARRVTDVGRRMLAFPVHPRQARMIVEAERRGIARDGAALAALVGERDIAAPPSPGMGGGRSFGAPLRPSAWRETHRSDLLAALDALHEVDATTGEPHRLRAMGLDPQRVLSVQRVRAHLERNVDKSAQKPATPEAHERAELLAILAGYPDRVGRLRRPGQGSDRSGREIVFAGGGSAALSPKSVVGDEELVTAVDVEERAEGRTQATVVRTASAVEEDFLLDLFIDTIRDDTEYVWNASAERVEVVRRLAYDALVLEESRARATASPGAGAVLAAAARAKGWRAFVEGADLDRWLARLAFARATAPELELPEASEATIEGALSRLCEAMTSFAELRGADLGGAVRAELTPEQARRLAELAPDAVLLPGGRRARIEYEPGVPPWIASRLQDFFGMAEGPRIAAGRVPLVLHLLAPNQRAVQVTTDLAGFWSRHYPAIAKELRRKYPRHGWPDDPLSAAPPSMRKPR